MINRSHLQQLFLIVLASAVIGLCYVIVEPFIWPIVSACALAILSYPLHAALRRRMLRHPGGAAAVALILVIAMIAAPSIWIVSTMTSELTTTYATLKTKSAADGGWSEWIAHAGAAPLVRLGVDPATAEEQVRSFLSERIASITATLLRVIQGIVSDVAMFLFHAVVALFVLYFLLRDGDIIISKARNFLPLPHAVFDRLIAEVGRSVLANVYGVGAVAVAQGLLTGLLFLFVGVHSPVVWGVIAGFCSMIPIVGPPVVWVPVAIHFAIAGAWGKAAIVAAVGAGVIGMADNVIRPWIISGRVALHPLLVFISLLGGAQAFGFLGLFIGPAALSVAILILEFLKQSLGRREEAVAGEDLLPR